MGKKSEDRNKEIDVFKILSHKTRRQLLKFIGDNERATFTDLSEIEPKPGKLYYHLRLMSDLIKQNEDGSYSLTEYGYKVYELMHEGVSKTFKENQAFSRFDTLLSFVRKLVMRPSKDAILIINVIITAFIVYASDVFNVTILPYYIIVTFDNLLYTVIGLLFAIVIIPVYLKLDHSFTFENVLRVYFGYAISYSFFAFPILGLYALGLLTRVLVYVLTIPLQLLSLLIYSSTFAVVTKKSLLRNLTVPLITHYISSLMVIVTAV